MPSEQSPYIFIARTVQACIIKVLMDTLRELLMDTSLRITPEGISIIQLDNTSSCMISLRLEANRFEEFVCDESINIGVNLANFQKLLKTVNTNDTLTLFLEHGDRNRLGIRVENDDKRTRTESKLNLLDVDDSNLEIPPITFNSSIMLPSSYFQRIIRDMSALSDKVDIKSVGRQLILSCQGDFCSQETIMKDTDRICENGGDPDAEDEITQGVFSLRYLLLFTKCSSLSQSLSIFLRSDYPVILDYQMSLGSLKLCLSPQVGE